MEITLFKFLGFPYRNQEEMGVDLNKLLDPLMKSETSPLTEDDQLILMTHCGPTESCEI